MTFTSTLNRIFLGAVPLVAAAIYLVNSDRILDTQEVLIAAGAIALGAILLVSGLIGAMRLSTVRSKQLPTPTGPERVTWGLLTLMLALAVAIMVAGAARARNVMLVEQAAWQRALHTDSPAGYQQYLAFVAEHRPTRAAGPARLVRLNDTEWLFDMFTDSVVNVPAATAAYDDTSFRDALKKGTPQAFRDYLKAFNPGRHVGDASMALDDAVYKAAADTGTVASLRDYRKEYTRGRHAKDSRRALQDLYSKAEADYDALVAVRKADPAAAASFKRLLGAMSEDVDQDRAPLSFATPANLETLTAAVKVKGGATVAPLAPAFAAPLAAAREEQVLADLNAALQPVVGDLFQLELRPAADTRGELRVYVQPQVRATGDAVVSGPTAHAALELTFLTTVQVPETKAAPNTFTTKPAPKPGAGYEAMIDAAFTDYRAAILKAYGLGG